MGGGDDRRPVYVAAAGVGAVALAIGAAALARRGRSMSAPALPGAEVALVLPGDNTPVYTRPGRVLWVSNLAIDADGDPQAYHPDDWGPLRGAPRGLDAPENAGEYRNSATGRTWASWAQVPKWWGVAVGPGGLPVVQSEADPAPGYWVSTTSLVDPDVRRATPARYASSRDVPYIAVPPEVLGLGARVGDLALVSVNDRTAAAIVADVGPRRKVGEGSIALARALGLELPARMARILGVDGRGASRSGGVRFEVVLNSGAGRLMSAAEIKERGAAYG